MADEKKAAFGVFPQMKPRRSKQDREAAKNVPVDLARGVISGALGIPGDIESLARLPYELITGQESPTILPTSEDIEKRLPFKSDTPVGGLATGLGQIAGGFATPAPAIKAAKKLRQTIGNLPPADPRMSQMGVIKAPGGNWLTGSVEKAIEPLKMRGLTQAQADEMAARPTPIMMAREGVLSKSDEALNQWIDRNLTNYVKKQMATPDDPVRKLAEQGIDPQGRFQYAADKNLPTLEIIREELGFPPKGMGQSPQAQNWEKIADETTLFETAGDIIAIAQNNKLYGDTFQKYKKILEENPWLLKVDPNTPVYSPKAGNWSYGDTGFDHIVDVLRQDLREGRIRPEQLNKVSMEQAVRRTYEYDQEMAKKMREAQIKATEGMPIYKEYPEGYKWVELALPKLDVLPEGSSFQKLPSGMTQVVDSSGSPLTVPASDEAHALRLLGKERGQKTLENALKYEGETMGHCVGGYCPDVLEGRSRIFSLRDAKGEPHVTVEVAPKRMVGMKPHEFYNSKDVPQSLLNKIDEAEKAGDLNDIGSFELLVENSPEYKTYLQSRPEIQEIVQIKGKQNRAPKEEYLPFVQDFVKSGRWSDVGDLDNTGLYRAIPEELGMFVPEDPRLRNFPGRRTEDFIKAKEAGLFGDQKYLTRQEWEDILRRQIESEFGPLPPLEGMKKGGKVRFTDNPDAMRLELQMAAGGLAKGLKAAAKAAKPAEAPIKASEALGRVEGRPLVITQADRTKVGGGYLGGPGFSGLQLTEPEYRAAEAAWGVKTPGVAKMILGGGKAAGKDPVYAAMLGTPTQHQSNQMVFDKLYGDFKKSAKKGNLDPELRDLINTRLASAVDKKGNPVFPPDVDILGKNFKDLANTFDRRAVTANLIGGVTVGGKKGQIIDYDKIIRETTDPLLIEAPTGAVGNRLFTLSGGIIDRPDLHPAFPTILQGEDLGVSFNPVTRDLIMKDFIQQTMREKGRAPGYMDYTRGYPPSQLITEDLLTELQKLGLKKGGKVKITDDPEEMRREMAVGGIVKGLKKAAKASKGTQEVLPAAEREANLARFLEPSKVQQRLYHGTMATEGGKGQEAIRSLKPSKEGSLGSGVYMTPSTAQASGYSGSPNAEAIDAMLTSPYQADTALQFLRNQQTGNVLPGQVGGNMLPVYAQLKNPLVIDGSIARDPMVEALMRLGMDKDSAGSMVERAYERKGYIGKEVENRARAAGFDGIMQYRDGELSEVVSYNPSAVKSATGNIGTYDTRIKDLSKAAGGKVTSPAAQIDGNDFLLAARRHGLSEDIETLNKMVRLVNQGATVDEAARIVSGNAVSKAAGGEISADDLIIEERPL